MNKIGIFGGGLAIIGVVGLVWISYTVNKNATSELTKVDYKNATYKIDGQDVTLTDGEAEISAAPGSAAMVTYKYFGNVAKGDINGDGIPDLVFLITKNAGGSGTFYYAVGALQNEAGGYEGTEAVLIADRIAPQTTEIRDGKVIVNYADRLPGEPMTAKPSVGKSLYLKLDAQTLQFGELVQNFEGESR